MVGKASASSVVFRLAPVPELRAVVPVVGLMPLIMGGWSEQAKAAMRAAQMGPVVRAKKVPKDPAAEAEGRAYKTEDGRYAIPAVNFKAALVDACRFFEGLPMTTARRCIFVAGVGGEQMVPLDGEPEIREDMVRNATGVADIRYRLQFWPWRLDLHVVVRGIDLDGDSLVNLVQAAGQVGICEWRPSAPKVASGIFGTFEVDRSRQIRVDQGRR